MRLELSGMIGALVSRVNLRHEMGELHLPLLEPRPALLILTDEETEALEKQMTPLNPLIYLMQNLS